MITRIGFVLCEITGEYDDTTVTPIAYSDSSFELEQEIARLNSIVEEKQKRYDDLYVEASNLVSDLNGKLELALTGYDKELVFEEEIPKPENRPQTGPEHAEWVRIKHHNLQVNRCNADLRNEKKLEITNKFRKDNVVPNHLKEIVHFSERSYPPQFVIQSRPKLAEFEIRDLGNEDFKISSFDLALDFLSVD